MFIKCEYFIKNSKVLPLKHIYSSSGALENTKVNGLLMKNEKLYNQFYRKGENEKALSDISWFDFHATIN